MSEHSFEHNKFDIKLAIECAAAYSEVSGLGCIVSETGGNIIHESGNGCASCLICDIAGFDKSNCNRVHAYGMAEAERFGGKYIYFCPMGLTFFVSPIMGESAGTAKITVGPFLMIDHDDYITFDLQERLKLDDTTIRRVTYITSKLPYISTCKVNSLSTLLFMAVGFMNNVSQVNRMLGVQESGEIQSQITEYIMELKNESKPSEYPLKTEKALVLSIMNSNKQQAQSLLNELLGYILFSSGGDFARIKSRIYELLVIISRAAIDAGAPTERTFTLNHEFFQKAQGIVNIDKLCMLLSEAMNKYLDSLFDFLDVKNADMAFKAVEFMRRNFTKKITIEDVAKHVYLSTSYFGKIFKNEMGCSFNEYLNRLRIEKSKQLLLQTDFQLVDIAGMTGFEDQSYFTKVFKRITGMSPNKYKRSGWRQ